MQQLLTSISTQSDINKVMQPHSAQNMYVSTGNNSSANNRSNPQTGGGGIFRGPQQQPSSSVNALRGGGVSGGATRHVHVQPMYSQAALHQNMVLQPYTQYNPRQQTFPTSHLQYAPTPMPYYQYQYVPTLQQQPPPPPQHTHPRSAAVSVNSNNNTLQAAQVQQQQQQSGGNPGGGPGGTQSSQIQLLAGTVQGPGGNMSQVGVGVAPMVGVGVMSQSVVAPQPVQVQVQQSNRRRHQHRLPIIDPTTKKNILEDLDKSNSNTENDFSNEQQTAATTAAVLTEAHTARIPQQDGGVGIIHQHNLSNLPALGSNDIRTNAQPFNVPMEPIIQRPDAVGQTPIVSAMSDAPSVEILPTPQKTRSKKIPIVPPKNVSDSTSALPTINNDLV